MSESAGAGETERKPKHQSKLTSKKRLLGWGKKILTVPGFIAAAAATALISWAVNSLATGATTTQVAPVTVSVQTNYAQLPAFEGAPVAAVIPDAGGRSPASPRSCVEFFHEIKSAVAVPSPLLLQLIVQSDTAQAALIENMTIHVIHRSTPVRGALAECTEQGAVQFRSIDVDLDSTTPRAIYARGKRDAPFGFTLSEGQTEIFDVTARSKRAYVVFDIDLSLVVGGRPMTMKVTDDGRPFQVSAAPSGGWSWGFGSWTSRADGHALQIKAGQRFPSNP